MPHDCALNFAFCVSQFPTEFKQGRQNGLSRVRKSCMALQNSFIALCVVQGRMLSRLGVAWCLTAGPLMAACLMMATAVFPNTYMIGIGEIVRKVGRGARMDETLVHICNSLSRAITQPYAC